MAGSVAAAGSLSITGDVDVSGALRVSGGGRLGNVFVGDVGHGQGWAGLSHADAIGAASYGFLQSSDGRNTLINKRSGGGVIEFRVDNQTKLSLDDAGKLSTGQLTASGDVLLQAGLTVALDVVARSGLTVGADILARAGVIVGAGSNGALRTRHIDGKRGDNDNFDALHLNWSSGQPVNVGGGARSDLHVYGHINAHGGDINLDGGQTIRSGGRLHINPAEILYLLPGQGVLITKDWGASGTLHVDGDVRLGASDGTVFIGGNQTGRFIQFHDDLWFSDPQNGTIQLRNHDNSNWGTLTGFFAQVSSAEAKTDIRVLSQRHLGELLDDARNLDVVRFKYRGEDEDTGRERYGVIAERCPDYLLGVDGKSVNIMEYTAMLHGALKALAQQVQALQDAKNAKPAAPRKRKRTS